jgi:hypothetical protein
MKAMLSQPMAGKTDEEIAETRDRAVAALKENGYQVINTLFSDQFYAPEELKERGVVQIPLAFLAKSLENMSLCHAAYFCDGWENARGCRIEHEAAKQYGLNILYETQQSKYFEDRVCENTEAYLEYCASLGESPVQDILDIIKNNTNDLCLGDILHTYNTRNTPYRDEEGWYILDSEGNKKRDFDIKTIIK